MTLEKAGDTQYTDFISYKPVLEKENVCAPSIVGSLPLYLQ